MGARGEPKASWASKRVISADFSIETMRLGWFVTNETIAQLDGAQLDLLIVFWWIKISIRYVLIYLFVFFLIIEIR